MKTNFSFLLLICFANTFKKLIHFSSFNECNIIFNKSLFMLTTFIRTMRWKKRLRRKSWFERSITKIKIEIMMFLMFTSIDSQTSKKRARLLMKFIITMLISWRMKSCVASINFFDMQFILMSLLNNVLILTSLIDTFIVEQTTIYIERKKTIWTTIFLKCIDSIKLNFIDSTCIFFFFTIFIWAIAFRFLNIVFIFSSMMSRNICRKNFGKISSNSRNWISIEIFNICFVMSMKFDCFLSIWANFLNLSKISDALNEILNLIYLIFWYFVARDSKLILTIILIISILLIEIVCSTRFIASK